MTYLDEIVEYKRVHRQAVQPNLEARAAEAPKPRSLLASVGTYRTFLVAECKKASPSRGELAKAYDPVALARVYQENGAVAISVLTDERFFQGSLDDLVRVRQHTDVPVLRKDFTLDEQDLLEGRAAGADLVLLIARILDDTELRSLVTVSSDLGMEAIVEVHDEAEVQRALEASAPIIGINNRDLMTFETHIALTERLLPLIPRDITTVSESGIRTGEDVHRLNEAGVRGVLVGEALMRAPDTGGLVRELVEAGCPDCWARRNESSEPADTIHAIEQADTLAVPSGAPS